jgi:hypothetical protein
MLDLVIAFIKANLTLTLITAGVITLFVAVIILIITEIKIKKKISYKEEKQKTRLIDAIKQTRDSKDSIETKISKINEILKSFIQENYKIDKNQDYSEIIKQLRRKRKSEVAAVCAEIQKLLYSGAVIDEKTLRRLIHKIEALIKEKIHYNDIIHKEKDESVIEQIGDFIKAEIPLHEIKVFHHEERKPAHTPQINAQESPEKHRPAHPHPIHQNKTHKEHKPTHPTQESAPHHKSKLTRELYEHRKKKKEHKTKQKSHIHEAHKHRKTHRKQIQKPHARKRLTVSVDEEIDQIMHKLNQIG